MTALSTLWLPILLSAVVVFVLSSIVHMALPFWHRNDYGKLPNEDQFRTVVRPLAIPPGDYLVPCPGAGNPMKDPDHLAKVKEGPVMMMTVMPTGRIGMGKSLILWFVYLLVVGVFAAYVTGHVFGPGAPSLGVFRFVGVTAFLAYAAALWQQVIWFGRSWTATLRSTIDGLVYALFTAGMIGWLWPK